MNVNSNPALWAIYAGDVCIDHPNLYDQGRVVADIEIDLEVNAHGSMKFTVPITNPGYDTVTQLGTVVIATYGGRKVFRGRVADTTRDFYNNVEVYCEGHLAFLCDSMLPPFAYKGTVTSFLRFILDTHNSEVEDYKKLYLGTVTVTDPDNNGVLVRSSESSISSWEAVSGRLIDMLGGYVMVRETDGKYYVDYLAELTEKSNQTVEFGENLLDLEEHIDTENIVTVLYPFGARIEENGTNENTYDKYTEEPETSGLTLWHGNRVTVREANGGTMYVEDADGIKVWGKIWGTNVWDDVTLPSNLLTKAKEWLKNQVKATTTIELNAVDLHIVNIEIDDIQLGEIVHVRSAPHDLETDMPCLKIHLEPGAPDKSTVTLGATATELTKSIAKEKQEATTPEEIVKKVWERLTAAEGVAT